MISIPDRIEAKWIDTLGDIQLRQAESILHGLFAEEEAAEKARMGAEYEMMRGPASLLGAWMRWGMVSNELRERGVLTARRRTARAR